MSQSLHDDPELRRSLVSWQRGGVVVFALLVLAFPLYKAVESSRRSEAFASEQAALIAQGGRIWRLDCASCHGVNGQGVDAPALNAKEFLAGATDEQIHGIVAGGIPGTEMPAWFNEYGGPLTDQQITAVVTYIRSWEKTAPSRPDWRKPSGG